MHELAISEEMIAAVSEEVTRNHPRSRIQKVVLDIGKNSGVFPDAIRFNFELCSEGTPVQGAILEILESEGRHLKVKEIELID